MGNVNDKYEAEWLEEVEAMLHSAESLSEVADESNSQAEAESPSQPEVDDYLDQEMLLMIPVRITVRQYMQWFTWNCHVCGAKGNRVPPPYLLGSHNPVANVMNNGWRTVRKAYKRICSWTSHIRHADHECKTQLCPGDSDCGDGSLGHRGPCEKCTLSASISLVSCNGETIEFPGGTLNVMTVPRNI